MAAWRHTQTRRAMHSSRQPAQRPLCTAKELPPYADSGCTTAQAHVQTPAGARAPSQQPQQLDPQSSHRGAASSASIPSPSDPSPSDEEAACSSSGSRDVALTLDRPPGPAALTAQDAACSGSSGGGSSSSSSISKSHDGALALEGPRPPTPAAAAAAAPVAPAAASQAAAGQAQPLPAGSGTQAPTAQRDQGASTLPLEDASHLDEPAPAPAASAHAQHLAQQRQQDQRHHRSSSGGCSNSRGSSRDSSTDGSSSDTTGAAAKGAPAAAPAPFSAAGCSSRGCRLTRTAAALVACGSNPSLLPECRICLLSERQEDMLVPCGCAGSVAFAHLSCLRKWAAERRSLRCELCHAEYREPARTVLERLIASLPPQHHHPHATIVTIPTAAALALAAPAADGGGTQHHNMLGITSWRSFWAHVVVLGGLMGLILYLTLFSSLDGESGAPWMTIMWRVLTVIIPAYLAGRVIYIMVQRYRANRAQQQLQRVIAAMQEGAAEDLAVRTAVALQQQYREQRQQQQTAAGVRDAQQHGQGQHLQHLPPQQQAAAGGFSAMGAAVPSRWPRRPSMGGLSC